MTKSNVMGIRWLRQNEQKRSIKTLFKSYSERPDTKLSITAMDCDLGTLLIGKKLRQKAGVEYIATELILVILNLLRFFNYRCFYASPSWYTSRVDDAYFGFTNHSIDL